MKTIDHNQRSAFHPSGFAFGGATRPISKLMFEKYDRDKNGSISRDELRSLCYDMGYYLSDTEIEWALTLIDKDGDGKIDYDEFVAWWRTSSRFEHLRVTSAHQAQLICNIAEIFRSYDKHNHGKLNRREFEKMHRDLIQHRIINEKDHRACQFDEIDRGHDGSINFNELIAWLKDVGVLEQLGIQTP